MNTFYKIAAALLVATCTLQLQPAETPKPERNSTWRRPHFAYSNTEMNRNCNDICRRRGQDWTTNWSDKWFEGQKCECKNRPKWSFLGPAQETKRVDIEYRPAGAITNSHDLHEACTKKCEDYAEKYTGNWVRQSFLGYKCECQKLS